MERAAPARARVKSTVPPLAGADLVRVREAASGALGPAGPARLLARVVGAASLPRASRVDRPADRAPHPSGVEERLRHGRPGRGEAAARAPEPQRDGDQVGPQLPQPRRVA